MKIAPLIHSRTGKRDYNSKFAVCPTNFSADSILWARSKILAATRNIDRLNGIRRLVAAKDGICIAGIVCTMKYFINNCLATAQQDAAKPYADVQGRLYGVFIGYAFKSKGNEIPVVTNADLWQWFEKYLVPEWNKKSARTVEVDYFDWDNVAPAQAAKTSPNDRYFDVQLYDAAKFDDEKIFREYLSESLTSPTEIAFCSNVDKIQPVEDGIYTAVTTSAKNIAALKNLTQKKTTDSAPQKQSEVQLPATPATPTTVHKQAKSTSTSRKSLLLTLLIVLMLIVAIWFFVTSAENDSEQNLPSSQEETYKK